MLADAYTVMRAYLRYLEVCFSTTKPQPLASFEDWSKIVAGCLYWLTGHNVIELQKNLAGQDEKRNVSTTVRQLCLGISV